MLSAKMIGNKIAEARKKIPISQAQLAEKLFISSQAVGKWERGESMPDITTFNRLAEILGVDLNYFSTNFQSTSEKRDSKGVEDESSAAQSDEKAKKKNSWDMSSWDWVDVDFSGLKNIREKFSSSNMQRCTFIHSDLAGLLLKANNIEECNFSGSDISSSQIRHSHIVNNTFQNCSQEETSFSGSHIKGCDFSGVNFSGAVFKYCSLIKNTMANAVWNRSSFISSDIQDVVFDGKMEDCSFENCSFRKVTFQNAILTNTFFKSRKLKNIRFINCQADRMTYEVLKSGKANLEDITLIDS